MYFILGSGVDYMDNLVNVYVALLVTWMAQLSYLR